MPQLTKEERLKLPLNERYIGVVFEGSTFPDKDYKIIAVKLSKYIVSHYQPAFKKALPAAKRGLKLLLEVMADQEGFNPGTRSFENNNPGNIGNTDSGHNTKFPTLEAGILRQKQLVDDIIGGKSKSYPMGKPVYISTKFSQEIKNNPHYGLPYNLPGYRFTFTGQLDQFVKLYATGARAGNGYINKIVSYFHQNGLTITPESKIQDIVLLD